MSQRLTSLSINQKEIQNSGLSEVEYLRISNGCTYPDVSIPRKLVSTLEFVRKARDKAIAGRDHIRALSPDEAPSESLNNRMHILARKQRLLDRIEKGLEERLELMQKDVNLGAQKLLANKRMRP